MNKEINEMNKNILDMACSRFTDALKKGSKRNEFKEALDSHRTLLEEERKERFSRILGY